MLSDSTSLFATEYVRYNPKPVDVYEKTRTYFTTLPSRPKDDPIYIEALQRTTRDYHLYGSKVKPYHINDVIRRYPHPDRSPGLPHTTKGMRHKYEVPPSYIKSFVHNLKYGKYRRCVTPCNMVGKSMVGLKPKFRLIWVYPCHMTMAEGMFAMPLISAYQQHRGSYAIWCKYRIGHMKHLMVRKRSRAFEWLGLDWSAFDSNVTSWLIRDAFNILKDQINFKSYNEWGTPSTPGTLERLWDRIVEYFINTPFKCPDGHVEKKKQGVPSGSYFTNLIDSVCSSIYKHYCLLSLKYTYSRDANWELGDDGLTAVRRNTVSLDAIAEVARRVFGAVLNVDKSELGQFVSFIGYRMGEGPDWGIPQADYDKLAAQLLLPSRPDKTVMDFASRARALQLSCFGIGCRRFTAESQSLLAAMGITDPDIPHSRSEMYTKLYNLQLHDWPPLTDVITDVRCA